MAPTNLSCYGDATSDNKAYTRRSEYLAWPAAHLPLNRGKKILEFVKLILYKIFSKTWQTSCKHDVRRKTRLNAGDIGNSFVVTHR